MVAMMWFHSAVVFAQDMYQPGDEFKDCAACPLMVVVPAGAFVMGSPEDEPGRYASEGPARTVTFTEAFAIGKFEVTVEEWAACVTAGGCEGERSVEDRRLPQIDVNWDDASAYARWLSAHTGHIYRVPSEAEWEYAARGGTSTPFAWGSDKDATEICRHANAAGREADLPWVNLNCADAYEELAPVGQYPANGFGLHDMAGNLWELTADCANTSYDGAPSDGSPWLEGECAIYNVRGGSWHSEPASERPATRLAVPRAVKSFNWGFRLVRDLAAQ
jgi:formylglycine-generating enzyme required for sulfatase activity